MNSSEKPPDPPPDEEALESLDPDTLAAIERAEAQSARGESRPWQEVRKELQRKYLDGR